MAQVLFDFATRAVCIKTVISPKKQDFSIFDCGNPENTKRKQEYDKKDF